MTIEVGIPEPQHQQDNVGFASDGPVSLSSVMADLREDLSREVEIEDLELQVPKRPNIYMVFHPSFEYDRLKEWTRRSKDGPKKDAPVDPKKLCSIILAETCVGLKRKMDNREELLELRGADGQPLTFKHKELLDMLGVKFGGWYQAIEKMYASDGHVFIVAKIILEAAGYSDFDIESGADPLGH